ncbi:MAG: hypothetical protein JO127_15730 [Caulobacteraceae bacterium]|nr:hypothetical protein [Caulobacteraceae bacterium]
MNRHTFYLEQAARCSERSRRVRDPRRRQLLMMERQDWLALAHRLERASADAIQAKLKALVALQSCPGADASSARITERAPALSPAPPTPGRAPIVPPAAGASPG